MSKPAPDEDMEQPAASAVDARQRLMDAFSSGTPDDLRERVLDAVLAVLNGDDDD
jgi:hypothetical protein